jgi:hypothetical protein
LFRLVFLLQLGALVNCSLCNSDKTHEDAAARLTADVRRELHAPSASVRIEPPVVRVRFDEPPEGMISPSNAPQSWMREKSDQLRERVRDAINASAVTTVPPIESMVVEVSPPRQWREAGRSALVRRHAIADLGCDNLVLSSDVAAEGVFEARGCGLAAAYRTACSSNVNEEGWSCEVRKLRAHTTE